ncbi:MAG: ATP-grasp domain-containing protein [Deltaproteobacteria bacterium]|nr:ATP-grasp domain-containing protein [Deltaproteobacteria bacterium]
MMQSVLIANRGAIVRRIIRTCRRLKIRTVAVYSEADAHAPFVREADAAVALRGRTPRESYLDIARLMAAAQASGAEAVHPGYGFLSENPEFVEACLRAGLTFVGPAAAAMRQLGHKRSAKQLAEAHGVPTVPGLQLPADVSVAAAQAQAAALGFPLLIKAAAGGGGKGMRRVDDLDRFAAAWEGAAREAASAFGDPTLLVERYVLRPRHIEIQVLGDQHGHVVHCGERECSCQRRHQKIVEESPSPAVSPSLRAELGAAAVRLARAVDYTNAGTVEFLLAPDGQYYFLEMNTRLQVEHAVTEAVCGIDLVEWQLRIAAGEPLKIAQTDVQQTGHAIECRIYAEDPTNDFLPATGRVTGLREPTGPGVRLESGLADGMEVSIDYDPMLAKLITHAPTRAAAITRMVTALQTYRIDGVRTNIDFLIDLVRSPDFLTGTVDTHYVERMLAQWPQVRAPRHDPFTPWQRYEGWRMGSAGKSAPSPFGEREGVRGRPAQRGRRRGPHGDLTAPMPGRIVKVHVVVGDAVVAGQVLVVMEAMKMEYSITAPEVGAVKAVRCTVGELVERGAHLVEITGAV